MVCRCAPALVQLRNELDFFFPGRDKASDGCCGDAAHAARKSDHNPDAEGWAHAYDIDEDIAPAADLAGLWSAWRAFPDPRLKYLIYEGLIVYPNSTTDRRPRVYTGPNAHRLHMHVSITATATHDTSSWLAGIFGVQDPVPEVDMTPLPPLTTPEGDGAWLCFPDGAIWTCGNAAYFGGANQHMAASDRATVIRYRADGLYGYQILTVQSPEIGFTYPVSVNGVPVAGVPRPPVNQKTPPQPIDPATVARCAAQREALLEIVRLGQGVLA
jgi:hypothetical protein